MILKANRFCNESYVDHIVEANIRLLGPTSSEFFTCISRNGIS